MRSLALGLFIFSMATIAAWADAYTSTEGRFSVVFPSHTRGPAVTHAPCVTEAGRLDAVTTAAYDNEVGYFVAYLDYPASALQGMSDKTPLYAMMATGITGQINAKILSTTSFDFRGEKGISFSMQGHASNQPNRPLLGQANLVMKGNRIYMIYALSLERDRLLDAATRNFFASFNPQ